MTSIPRPEQKQQQQQQLAKKQQHDKMAAAKGLTFSKLGDWSTMTASRWHDAMYFEGAYFMKLWADTLAYTKDKAAKYCGGAPKCTNVEVRL